MPLYLRSIYVAIIGLWRFLIVLPILAGSTGIAIISIIIGIPIVLAFFSAVQMAPMALTLAINSVENPAAAMLASAIGLGVLFLVLGILGSIITSTGMIFMGLVAIRTSLMAEGEYSPVDLWRLIKVSLKYAVTFTLTFIVLAGLIGGVGFMLSQLGVTDLPPNFWQNEQTALTDFANSKMVAGLMITYSVIVFVIYVIMMVPMAGAAWSATDKMQPLDIFWGIGSSFFTMALVIGTAMAAQIYFDLGVKTVQFFAYAAAYLMGDADGAAALTWPELQPLVIAVGLNILLFYWQYVAAALAFLNRRARLEAARIEASKRPKSDWVDPTELRRAREGQASIFH